MQDRFGAYDEADASFLVLVDVVSGRRLLLVLEGHDDESDEHVDEKEGKNDKIGDVISGEIIESSLAQQNRDIRNRRCRQHKIRGEEKQCKTTPEEISSRSEISDLTNSERKHN